MKQRDAEWWRGQSPDTHPAPPAMRDAVVIAGARTDLVLPEVGPEDELLPLQFNRADVRASTISVDWKRLSVFWSLFEGCAFVQARRSALNTQGSAAQGSFANRPSLYRSCSFTGVRFGSPGRFYMGEATFEGCTFHNCRFNANFAFTADFVDCTFVGKIDGCAWYGHDPETGRKNRFEGNDLTSASITTNVGFRAGFDPSGNKWPTGFVPAVSL